MFCIVRRTYLLIKSRFLPQMSMMNLGIFKLRLQLLLLLQFWVCKEDIFLSSLELRLPSFRETKYFNSFLTSSLHFQTKWKLDNFGLILILLIIIVMFKIAMFNVLWDWVVFATQKYISQHLCLWRSIFIWKQSCFHLKIPHCSCVELKVELPFLVKTFHLKSNNFIVEKQQTY